MRMSWRRRPPCRGMVAGGGGGMIGLAFPVGVDFGCDEERENEDDT